MNELMKDGKEEVVSNLYTLRAGLSVISQEKDKAQKKLENAKNRREKSFAQAQEKCDDAKDQLEFAKESLKEASKKRKNNEEEANSIDTSQVGKKKTRLNLSRVGVLLTFVLELGFAFLLVWSIIFLAVYFEAFGKNWLEQDWLRSLFGWAFEENGMESTLSAILFWFAPLPSLGLNILGVFLIVKALRNFGYSRYGVKREVEKRKEKFRKRTKAKENIVKFENEENQAKQIVNEKKKEYQLARKEYANECQEIDKKYDEDEQKALKHVVAGMEMWEALRDTFSKQLDTRDWGNVDLIIYNMETGRADTVKEALQLTDRERQTERIEQAMSQATQEISRQIVAGVNYLEKYIGKCTTMLSDHLTNCATTLLKQNASIEMSRISDMANLTSYVTELSSQVKMNNALRAKANESSAKLVEDVHSIRELAAGHKIY